MVNNFPITFSGDSFWQELANSHHLSFIPGDLDSYCQVTGAYRGHHLTLSYKMGYTQILIFVNHLPKNYRNLKKRLLVQRQITVQDVLDSLLPAGVLDNLKGVISAGASGQTITYRQQGFENDPVYLQFLFDLLCNLASIYPLIADAGGSAIPIMYPIAADFRHKLQPYAAALLRSIAEKTETQLGWQRSNLLCPQCLVYCGTNQIHLSSFETITYYGCRSCGQSHDFREWEGKIIAVLDSLMTKEAAGQNNILKVNWLMWRKLFDFDEVHIIHATDEDVERFAVQVGNDTDETRKPRYQQMCCNISANCQLSPNTMRILQHTFGPVNSNHI